MECAPLAWWDPNEALVFATEECETDDGIPEDGLEPSKWVRRMIKCFGKYVGFLIASYERQCIVFFQQLKKAWEEEVAVVNPHQIENSSEKGMRELWNLISNINYDGLFGRTTRGSVKSVVLGSYQYP